MVVFVADSSYAVLELLAHVSRLCRASLITRLRLDAALYDPPPEGQPGQKGRPRLKGDRRPTLHAVLDDPEAVGGGGGDEAGVPPDRRQLHVANSGSGSLSIVYT